METPHYVVLDTETTGLAVQTDRILDLGVVYLREDGSEIARAGALVNPGCEAPAEALELTGISAEDIRAARPFADFAPRLAGRLRDVILVGHNLPDFDAPILAAELGRCGCSLRPRRCLDTIRLWKTIAPELGGYGLAELCASLGVAHTDAHRALPDALATAELLRLIIGRGLVPEEIEIDLTAYHRARSLGNTEPATEGQVARLKRLVGEDHQVRQGMAPAERLRGLLSQVGAQVTPAGFEITQEQVQQAFEVLEAA